MSDVRVERSPSLDLFAHPEDCDRRVADRVETLLREAGGSWHATVRRSAAMSDFWLVHLRRGGDDGVTVRSVIFDERAPAPDAELQRVIAEMAGPARARGRCKSSGDGSRGPQKGGPCCAPKR